MTFALDSYLFIFSADSGSSPVVVHVDKLLTPDSEFDYSSCIMAQMGNFAHSSIFSRAKFGAPQEMVQRSL